MATSNEARLKSPRSSTEPQGVCTVVLCRYRERESEKYPSIRIASVETAKLFGRRYVTSMAWKLTYYYHFCSICPVFSLTNRLWVGFITQRQPYTGIPLHHLSLAGASRLGIMVSRSVYTIVSYSELFVALIWLQVNVPKTKKSFCRGKECKKHTLHKVTQYKKGKDSLFAQGTIDH